MINLDNFSTTRDLVHDENGASTSLFADLNQNPLLAKEGGLRKLGYKKSQSKKPLITIITAVFNGGSVLEDTILSVLKQDYDHIELIIIDGGSSDETIDIIKKYNNEINYWVSEPDHGIADAFNKGIRIAQGDYINFQGAGDTLISSTVISEMMKNVNQAEDMLVCGRIQRVADTEDKKVLYIAPKKYHSVFNKRSLMFRMSLPHQALFTHRDFFRIYGLFDQSYVFSMDYEQILRAYKSFPKIVMKNTLVSSWRAGGIGTNRTREIFDEYFRVKVKNNIAPKWMLYLIHLWILVKYYLKFFLVYLGVFKAKP